MILLLRFGNSKELDTELWYERDSECATFSVSWMWDSGRDFERMLRDWIDDIFNKGLKLAVKKFSG